MNWLRIGFLQKMIKAFHGDRSAFIVVALAIIAVAALIVVAPAEKQEISTEKDSIFLPWIAVMLTGSFLVCVVLKMWNERRVQRMTEMRLALIASDAFKVMADKFTSDSASPKILVTFIQDFEFVLSKHDASLRLAIEVRHVSCSPSPDSNDPEMQTMLSELKTLDRDRPDLADAFKGAVGSGLARIFLFWPENALFFTEVIARLASDPWRGATHVLRAQAMLKAENCDADPIETEQIIPA